MNAQVASQQSWPSWAKAILVAMVILAVLVTLPWVFMWTAMAASCVPMMDGMREMMGPEMMR
jgi:hypothetical protein